MTLHWQPHLFTFQQTKSSFQFVRPIVYKQDNYDIIFFLLNPFFVWGFLCPKKTASLMSSLCLWTPAVIMLHNALLKVLHIFFKNFPTDFRAPEVARVLPVCDVDLCQEICQFNIAALYKLDRSWLNVWVCVCVVDNPQTFSSLTHSVISDGALLTLFF